MQIHRGPRREAMRGFLPQPKWLPEVTTPVVTIPGRVSYIIPAYNAEHTLSECLRSIFNQTRHPQEIIIVDDASTDETWQVVHDMSRGHETIIAVQQQRNLGASAARNRAIRMASGEFVIFQDADDVAPLNRTELCLQLFADTGADLIYGQKERFARDCRHRVGADRAFVPTPHNIVRGTGCGMGAMATRRHLHLDRNIWLDETMAGAEDADLLMQCLSAGVGVHCSDEVLCWRRESETSLRNYVDWGLMRRYMMCKHRRWLERYVGRPMPVTADEEEEIWQLRRDAGTVRVENTS